MLVGHLVNLAGGEQGQGREGHRKSQIRAQETKSVQPLNEADVSFTSLTHPWAECQHALGLGGTAAEPGASVQMSGPVPGQTQRALGSGPADMTGGRSESKQAVPAGRCCPGGGRPGCQVHTQQGWVWLPSGLHLPLSLRFPDATSVNFCSRKKEPLKKKIKKRKKEPF